MAEQNLFCLCGRCSRKLRSAAARRVGNKATEQRDRAENMLRNVSKEYAEIAMDCVNAMDRADKCQRELEKIREEHGEQ